VVEDDTRVSGAARTPDQELASSLTRLAVLVPDIGAPLDIAIQLASSACVFQTTIHGNLSTTATSEVVTMGGDNDIPTLETLHSVEKQLHDEWEPPCFNRWIAMWTPTTTETGLRTLRE